MIATTDYRLASATLLLFVSVSLQGAPSVGVLQSGTVQDDAETLEWLDDYEQAFALARETRRPVFLEFRCAP